MARAQSKNEQQKKRNINTDRRQTNNNRVSFQDFVLYKKKLYIRDQELIFKSVYSLNVITIHM